MAETPIDQRSEDRIVDDVVAALTLVRPLWVELMDPPDLPDWVRQQLDDLEALARVHRHAETGCMVVDYDPDDGKTTWSVVIATRWDEDG